MACDRCRADDPDVTAAVPGEGSPVAPVVLVGQAPAPKCIGVGPFTGGSGELIDAALGAAGRDRSEVFITNAVHCFLPNHRPPRAGEIDTHLPHLRGELEIVSPRLVIGMGRSAEKALRSLYPGAVEWSPRRRTPRPSGPPLLLFVKHPNRIRQWERAEEPAYVRRLATAIRWAFAIATADRADQ